MIFKRTDFEFEYLHYLAKKAILNSIISATKSNQKGWEDRAFVLSQTYRNITNNKG